jgi:DNA-binding NarL/FixJ family response regulator
VWIEATAPKYGVFTLLEGQSVDRLPARVSRARMSHEKGSHTGSLSLRERAFLEYCAEGLSDREIAVRLHISHREVSAIRGRAGTKLAARVAPAHPFQIREVVLAG